MKAAIDNIYAGVAAGVAWLDRVEPGWHWDVQPELIRMESGRWCTLGQLECVRYPESGSAGWTWFRAAQRRLNLDFIFLVENGFLVWALPGSGHLESAWAAVIGQRRLVDTLRSSEPADMSIEEEG